MVSKRKNLIKKQFTLTKEILAFFLISFLLFPPLSPAKACVCQNECASAGQKKCSDSTHYQICGNYDADSCLEWSVPQSCGSGKICQNGDCIPQCTSHYTKKCYDNDLYWYDSCQNREEKYEECGLDIWTDNYRCSGNWVQREKNKKGCTNNACYNFTQWENYEDCSVSGKICQNGICVSSCQDECLCLGQHQCSGTSGRTCGNYDLDSCLEWSSWQNCDSQCYTCDDGNCNSDCGENSSNCPADCGYPSPVVDIKANGSDGPITIPYNTVANLTWTSSNTNSCSASNGWSGSKLTSGSESTGNLTVNKTYTLTCTGSGGSASDSVTVKVSPNHPPVANAGSDKEVYETESVVLEGSGVDPDGDSITYSWSCNGGSLSNSNLAQPVFYAPSVSQNKTFTCTLTVTDAYGLSDSDSMSILVREHESPTLSVLLESYPSSGCVPLNGVDLKAAVSGTATGYTTFLFDCNNDGIWEKIDGIYYYTYTASNLCNYSAVGTYTAKVRAERQGLAAEDTVQINVYSCYAPPPVYYPTVNVKANGSDGPITIPYNTSATLSWTSTNANYCYASGSWYGSKSTWGSESTGNLYSTKTYTLTCTGSGGSASDSVTVYVTGVIGPTIYTTLTVNKMVRNLSDGTVFLDSVFADPSEVLTFSIEVRVSGSYLYNVIIRDTLPDKIKYRGNLKIDGVSSSGDIISGLNLGYFSPGQTKTITFDADILSPTYFSLGETSLTNSVLATANGFSASDLAKIIVTKKAVAGVATGISTGLTNNLFVDSFFLPLVIAILVIFVFRNYIIEIEDWLELEKRKFRETQSQKILQLKISQIKSKEFLRKKII